MKTKNIFLFISFTSFLSLAYAKPMTGGIDKITPAKLAMDYSSLLFNQIGSLQEKFFEKKLANKPEYLVNTYLGTFQTSFIIDLPKNDFLKNGLAFDYNSSQNLNYGFGVGFNLHLPKISERDKKHYFNSPSSNELVEVVNRVNISARLDKISKTLNRKLNVLKTFKLKDDEDFSLFIQLPDGFLQLSLSGESFLYNSDGLLVTQISSNQKVVNFNYNDQRLSSIYSQTEGWSVELNYKESEAQYKYVSGHFYQIPRGLNWIDVKQNQTVRRYNFSYDNDLLIKVRKDGALHDLFTATYQTQKGKMTQAPFNGSGLATKNIVFRNADKTPEFVDLSSPSDKQVILTDLNGDFVTDEVTFQQSQSEESSKKKFQELFKSTTEVSCEEHGCTSNIIPERFQAAKAAYQAYLNSQTMNVTVKFGKFVNQSYQLESDSSLSMSFPINDFGSYSVKGDGKLSISFDQIRIPRFLDINSDGKKDLILVSYKAEKNFVEKNKKQDILVVSAFNLTNLPSEDNIFNYEGDTPIAYLLKTDEEKIRKLNIDSSADIYQLPGVSYWEKTTPPFKMNSQSMLLDYNRDGVSDILTGKTVYLIGDNGETQSLKLKDDDLKKLFDVTYLTADSLAKAHYGLLDSDGTGIWKTFMANNYYIQPTDRKLHIISNSDEFTLERPSDVPLLISLKSTFGGSVDVSYNYVDGAYVVKQVKHNLSDLDQNSWEENFTYTGTRWHVQKNIFLGFKKGTVEKKLISNKNHQALNGLDQRVVEYDLDNQNGTLFYLSRARKAGRVINEKVIDKDGIEKEISNKYIDHMFENRRSFSYLLSQNIHEKGKSDLKIINDYPKFLNETPVSEREIKTTSTGSEISFSDKILIDGMYLLRTNSASVTNRLGEHRSLEKNVWSTQGLLLRRVTPSNLETFNYDNLGRISKYETSNGKIQTYSYIGELPLVKDVTINDLKTNYSYNDVENDISAMAIEGSPDIFHFTYTTDGILSNIKRNDQSIFDQTRVGSKAFESITLDEKVRIKLDGYGRVVSRTQIGEGDNLILSQKSLDDQDRSIVESGPYFENVSSPWSLTERKYDALGSVVNEVQTDDQDNKLTEFSLTKTLCSEKITEIGFRETLCKDGNDNTTSTSIPNESSAFEYGFSGEVSAIKPFGHTYKRNENGDIIESSSAAWGKATRTFNYKDNSVAYDDGVLEFTTPFGEFQSYTNGLDGAAHVSIEATYEKRLLKSLELNLGNKHFTQSYSYNPSRVLIAKKEFNTAWSYTLDQFDRVQTETIKDTKNEYTLNYNRTNSIVTSITPYVTNIEYSSRMKPTLIEFSNGSSIEYEYGPRGELLSYSLTKGMIVFYRAKYQYRSDLKLISQSVITNMKLDEQVQTFSYDNSFEVSKKPSILNYDRDEKGQVTKANDLTLGYHHLNLVQISQSNNMLTNFYSENNHYVGSCNQAGSCFYKISSDEIEYNGEIQKLIKIGEVPIGLLYKGRFYPVIVDHKLAVIGLLNESGTQLQFLRSFDEWGNLKNILGNNEFEKTISFSFSKLLQNPLVEKNSQEKIYFSETRIYSSKLGQWLSPDSTIVWGPEKLLKLPGNWDPFKYANNDPLNYLDQGGQFVHLLAAGAVGALGGSIYAAARGENITKSAFVGFVTGVSVASGAGLVAEVVSFAAQSSVVSIFAFTGNLTAQALTGKISMTEAITVSALGPFSLGYSKLFEGVGSRVLSELVSGMSFMSVDLLASFSANKLHSSMVNNNEYTSGNSSYEKCNFGNYKLQSSYGN